jgi:hypothetical protein
MVEIGIMSLLSELESGLAALDAVQVLREQAAVLLGALALSEQ